MSGEYGDIVHNRLSSQKLSQILNLRGWSERKLAELSGILPSIVAAHLSGKQVIGSHHLAAYLTVLDRQERAIFLDAWLRDNLDPELIADLLDGTKTDSMPTLKENQGRMLDWWATALAGNFERAKAFSDGITRAGFKFPSLLFLPVGAAFTQLESRLLEKACSFWYVVRSLCSRVEQGAVALAALILALCQDAKVPQHAGELAEQASSMAATAITTSVAANAFISPALAEAGNIADGGQRPSLAPLSSPATRKGNAASRTNHKTSRARTPARHQNDPAVRVAKTIEREWHQLVTRKSLRTAFAPLLHQLRPRQSKQKHR